MKTVWDDLYDEDWLSGLNAKLRAAQRVSDKQCFGMIRQANTDEFIKLLTEVRSECDALIKRAGGK
jgi:hypothetical protein